MPVGFSPAYPEHDQNVLKGEFWGRGKALAVARQKHRANRHAFDGHHTIAYAFILCKAAGNLKSRVYHQPESLVSFLWLLEAWNLLWAYWYLWRARCLCRRVMIDQLSPEDLCRACRVLYDPRKELVLLELQTRIGDTLNHGKNLTPEARAGLNINLCLLTMRLYPDSRALHGALFDEIGSPKDLVNYPETLLDYYRLAVYWFRLRNNQATADHHRELALSLARRNGWDDQVLKIEAERNAPLFL